MARARRTSAILETARQGLNGQKSITPGPNLTPDGFAEAVTSFIARPDTYNQHVGDLDQEQNQLEAAEVGLRDQNRRILLAVATQFEPDSSEYEKAARGRASASGANNAWDAGSSLAPSP